MFTIGNPKAAAHVAIDLQCWYSVKYEYNRNNRTHGRKKPKNFIEIVSSNKITETSSSDETQTKCMHCIPSFSCTVYPAKVGIKMHALSSYFISAVLFGVSINSENSKIFLTVVGVHFLVMQMYSYMHAIENMPFGRIIIP